MKEWQALSGAGETLYTWTSMVLFSRPGREFFIDNLLVRIHLIIEMILVDRPCAMGLFTTLCPSPTFVSISDNTFLKGPVPTNLDTPFDHLGNRQTFV